MVWEWRCSEDLEEKADLINDDKGVCRTAPVTPELLNIYILIISEISHNL